MGLLDLFRKKDKNEKAAESVRPTEAEESEIYSGMRIEASTFDGRILFAAKLMCLHGNTAELHQYTESSLSQDTEPIRVRIRGYNDHRRRAVYMEGIISPKPKHIWQVDELTVVRSGNDRAFFRLETDLPVSITLFGGFGAGEREGRLLNISVGGACVALDHKLHVHDKFLLKVKLLEDRDTSVMYCEVLRALDKGEDGFHYGCQFLELNDADESRITQNIFAAQRRERTGR